jgi:hypothetical protein
MKLIFIDSAGEEHSNGYLKDVKKIGIEYEKVPYKEYI